jgi:hypothetical protein
MKDEMYGDGSREMKLPFTIPKAAHVHTEEKQKSSPIIAYALCPMHHEGEQKRTGLQRQGTHVVFRDHRYKVGRQMLTCRASGVALCVAPPTDGLMWLAFKSRRDESDDGKRVGRCPHEAVT